MEIKFDNDYMKNEYILLESTPDLMKDINTTLNSSSPNISSVLNLKQGSTTNTVILTTIDKSYELKNLESSNQFLLVENDTTNKKLMIKSILNNIIEVTKFVPSISYLLNLLKKESTLSYNLSTGQLVYSLSSLGFEDLLLKSDFSESTLKDVLLKFGAFEKNNKIFIFEESFRLEMTKQILLKIRNNNSFHINDDVFDDYAYLNLNSEEKRVLLEIISDKEVNSYLINLAKLKDFIGLLVKQKYQSNIISFVSFKSEFQLLQSLYCSIDVSNKLIENDVIYTSSSCEDNLYEYFNEMDLRFLKGKAILKINSHEKTYNCDLIFFELENYNQKFDKQLLELFSLKDTWSFNEISAVFSQEDNLKDKIGRYCKLIYDKNQFISNKEIVLYKHKFKK